jgi:hypothetical protein
VLRSLARKLIGAVAYRVSERRAVGLLTAACAASPAWTRAALRVPHLESSLDALRLDAADLESALERARKQAAGRPLFVLTDRADLRRLPIAGATWIEGVGDLPAVDGPIGVVLLIEDDIELLSILDELDRVAGCSYYTPRRTLPPARYFQRNRAARAALAKTRRSGGERSHFDPAHMENIMQAIEVTREVPGDYVEIGVYRGDSAYAALTYLREASIRRRSWFFDTFDGFSYDAAAASKDAQWAGTHGDTSLDRVRKSLSEFRDCRIERLEIIAEELPAEIDRIACANVDVDMYDASLAAVHKVAARLALGGVIVLDDQGHTPHTAGAFRAARHFLGSEAGRPFVPVHLASGQMFLVRTS